MMAVFKDGLICVHVAPRVIRAPHTSCIRRRVDDVRVRRVATLRTPRGEHVAVLLNSAIEPVQSAALAEPLWMKVQVVPPFVVL